MKPLVASLVALSAGLASAEPAIELRLQREPTPRSLKMRRAVALAPSPPARKPTPMPAAPPPLTSRAYVAPVEDQQSARRDLANKVSFSLDLGYQVDAASPSGKASLDARAPTLDRDYTALRSYGFGELFGSTRGLGMSNLSTYFAVRFQAVRQLRLDPEAMVSGVVPTPIATWFERSGLEPRSGWAELVDFLPKAWGLSKVRVRAGGQYIYAPWVVHLDGVTVAYDGTLLQAAAYSGVRHTDYTRSQSDRRPAVAGASLRVDLRGLPRPLPIAVQGELLALGESVEAEQPATQSMLVQGDWRPDRDIAVIGQLRARDGQIASQRVELRARYKQVTNLVFDLTRRTEDDWRWDPSLVSADLETGTARRYLDLGPVVPQVMGSLRAGTLIAENVDLYLRGAFAANPGDEPGAVRNTFASPYAELGGAFEVRLRRTIALGGSVLTRDTQRGEVLAPVRDVPGMTEPLPANDVRGEEGFTEAGGTLKLSLGARQFSTAVEVYGRRTRYAILYEDPLLEVPSTDLRLGGRVSLDAWIGPNLKVYAAYDATSTLDMSPQVTGYRSLRLMMSGVY
ncbi:MAG TPA: hypothetical protein VM513_10645 [Kofleriaceae bacterium]|nr:hypothetical protein [Kofleriaceae bacterium]